MWLYQSKFNVIGWCKKISKVPDIRENGMNAESQLVDVIKFDSIFTPHSRKITWFPKYIKYFDSYENLNSKSYFPDEYYPLVKYGKAKKVYKKHNKPDNDTIVENGHVIEGARGSV